jgi:hypothetical protein
VAILLAVVVTFVFLVCVGWARARVMNFEVEQDQANAGFSRFVQQ